MARAVVGLLLAALAPLTCLAQAEASARQDRPLETVRRQSGLRGKVSVLRDARGVPHIRATNESDAYFAQGYATASDRLWQMDLLRRTARGELAEIFGSAVLDSDREFRTLGFADLTASSIERLDPAVRRALESYAQGVNAFVEECRGGSLPVEFSVLKYEPAPWRVEDSIVVGKLFAVALATSWQSDLMRAAFADLPPERRERLFVEHSPLDVLTVGSDRAQPKRSKGGRRHSAAKLGVTRDLAESSRRAVDEALGRVGLYAVNLAASNSWVVAGSRSASGKPMLANDPHLSPSVPSIWHMVHLECPGLSVAGAAVVGWPGVVLGHNDRIAWGATNMGADVQDLFALQFDPANPTRYRSGSAYVEATIRHETIRVRTSFTDLQATPVDQSVTETRYGPVVLQDGDRRYALSWGALQVGAVELQAFYFINRAGSWSDFSAALESYTGPVQNFVYCDVDGHIGYCAAGPVPVRTVGDGTVPYDATKDSSVWSGTVRPRDMPRVLDPASGVIVTANNRVVGETYPWLLTKEWAPPYRARRIWELLGAKSRLTVEDFRQIQADTYSYADALFAREVVNLAASHVSEDREWAALNTLFANWDGRSSAESRQLAMSFAMRRAFTTHILEGALGAERAKQFHWSNRSTFIDWVVHERPADWLPSGYRSYEHLILECYREARASLEKSLGADEARWTWGNYSGPISFEHPLASVPGVGGAFAIPSMPRSTGGSDDTVNVGSYVSMRMIVDAADWDHTRMGLPLGESGDPSSPHWKDQLESWQTVNPQPFAFSSAALARSAPQSVMLTPP